MKNLLTSVFLLLALAACQQKQWFKASPEIDLVKKGSDSYLKADWATLRSLYADTAEIHVNSWTESMTPDQFIEFEKEGTSNYTSYSVGDDAVYEMIVNDDGEHWVLAWLQHTSKLKNGKEVPAFVHIASRVEGGKVVFQAFTFDTLPGFLAMTDSTKTK